jgi:asparagine synthase (glutamine-hydrolysing)
MSGICGLFRLESAPALEVELRAMTAILEQRGPDRTGLWIDGPTGFGHTLLATTPELQFEGQPFRHAETGCLITADVRLDNRDELLHALAPARQPDSIGDAELILLSYLEWAEDCPLRLLGDFAFALWDPRDNTLFCARDHFGMRPLYYHYSPGRQFLFASDPKAILVLPQVPYRINEGRIADFLVTELEWIDYTSTFFEGVYRLPPGHKARITSERLDVAEYWRPRPGPELEPMSDEEYKEGFLDVFTEAVKARLRAPINTVGSTLSGGVDSGSVVATAKDILVERGKGPLPTYSAARRPGSDCDESQRIYAALTMKTISPTLVHPDELGAAYDSLAGGNDEPFDGEFTILKALYLKAHEHGRRVVLDGAAGDVVLGEGSYIVRLIRKGRLWFAFRELAAENRYWGVTPLASDIYGYLRAALVPELLKKPLRPLRNRYLVRRSLTESLISPDFAASIRVSERFERLNETFASTDRKDYAVERCDAIRPNLTAGRERYARLAAASGVEARDPFLDRRVVDYCARLPGHLRLRDGWPKFMLRDLMSGRLPDEVCWSLGKQHLGRLYYGMICKLALDRGELDLSGLQQTLDGYVDKGVLANAYRRFRNGGDVDQILSAFLLSVWLRENASRPVVTNR